MSRVLGRYELLRPLARGGMAELFLARRRAAGVDKIVVVKRIRPERSTEPRFLELFVREARLSMSLVHQNIVPVFDFGRSGDQVFLAMERVDGWDLGSTLARAGGAALPPVVAAFVAAECCQALAYAHARTADDGAPLGVVHRDVTPRNVLVSRSGEVKLTDFGIAALAGDANTDWVGTPGYMAPEQARGEPVDARADLYALGLVLREMMTGVRARDGATRHELVERARSGELAAWPAGCDPELVRIAERATAPRVGDRFATAREMFAALDDYIVGARATARGEAPARQLADWVLAVWAGVPEEPLAGAVGELALESMLGEAAHGTGTERSLAETRADAVPAAASPSRTRALPIALVLLGAVALAIVVAWPRRNAAPRPPLDASVAVAPPDAAAVVVTPEPVAIDAAVAPAPPPPRPRITRPAAPAIATRKVRVGARPWAVFTVDGGARRYETITTIELAPGPHRLRFSNPELGVEREVTIDVPPDRDLDHVEDLRR